MNKSLDKRVTNVNDEYIYYNDEDQQVALRSLTSILKKYHSIDYRSCQNLPENSLERFNIYMEQNNQKIVLQNTIIYDDELDMADTLSIITRREYEDDHGLSQTSYYFYNIVAYENGVSYSGIPTETSKYGTMEYPFKYLKNSSYYAESLRMACLVELGGLEDIQGKFLLDIEGEELVIPTFPMKVWFEEGDVIHARYSRFSDGKIYNTKHKGIEQTYLL